MFFTLLAGPFGKYIGIIMGIVLLAGSAFGYVKVKEHQAAAAALLKFNQAQLEETIKENTAYKAKIDQLEFVQQQLIDRETVLNATIDKNAEFTYNIIKNSKHGASLDPIFNEALKSLNKLK